MYKHRVWSVVAVFAILATIVSACAPAQPQAQPAQATQAPAQPQAQPAQATQAPTTGAAKPYKVGVLWDFLQVERRVKARDYLEAEAKRLGFEIVFQNANGDEKLQLQQAENLITQGVNLI